MREIIARLVALFTLGVVVALSFLFASAHNRPKGMQAEMPATLSAPELENESSPGPASTLPGGPVRKPMAETATQGTINRGRAVYEQQNCATCHSIAGAGNPRNPLDGVGATWSAIEMEEWITGTGAAAEVLPAAIAKRKQRYRAIPAADRAALVAYLLTLKPTQ
jgi:mono/diheme cytochrome c family protein